MRLYAYLIDIMQESLCADAASFDLPSGLLTTCISEAKSCVDLSVARREESNDKSRNPDNFAILRGVILFWFLSSIALCSCHLASTSYSHTSNELIVQLLQHFF